MTRRWAFPLVAAVVLLAFPAPAGAHEGTAVIAVEQAAPRAGSLDVRVRVTWSSDGHAATGATVTAVLVPATGQPSTPVTLRAADAEGAYAGVVPVAAPGDGTLRVTVVEPPGVLEQPVSVPAPTTTAAPTTTTAAATTTTPAATTAASTTRTAAAATTAAATTTTTVAPEDISSGRTTRFWVSMTVSVLVIVGAAVLIVRAWRSRGRDEDVSP